MSYSAECSLVGHPDALRESVKPIWGNRRIEVLTRRRVYKQQENEAEGGKQA